MTSTRRIGRGMPRKRSVIVDPTPFPTRPVFRENPVVMSDSGNQPVFSTIYGINMDAIAEGRVAVPFGPARKEKVHGGSMPLSHANTAVLIRLFGIMCWMIGLSIYPQ